MAYVNIIQLKLKLIQFKFYPVNKFIFFEGYNVLCTWYIIYDHETVCI